MSQEIEPSAVFYSNDLGTEVASSDQKSLMRILIYLGARAVESLDLGKTPLERHWHSQPEAAYAEACRQKATEIFQHGLQVYTSGAEISIVSPTSIARLDFKGLGDSERFAQ